jgi:hypothetical protein
MAFSRKKASQSAGRLSGSGEHFLHQSHGFDKKIIAPASSF